MRNNRYTSIITHEEFKPPQEYLDSLVIKYNSFEYELDTTQNRLKMFDILHRIEHIMWEYRIRPTIDLLIFKY